MQKNMRNIQICKNEAKYVKICKNAKNNMQIFKFCLKTIIGFKGRRFK